MNTATAIIISTVLLTVVYSYSNRYEVRPVDKGDILILDKWESTIHVCITVANGCFPTFKIDALKTIKSHNKPMETFNIK